MAGISVPGIGSNLDVNSIVTQLMQVEQQPLVTLTQRQAQFTAQISALGRIKSSLFGFQTAAAALKTAGGNTPNSFISSDAASVSGSASQSAAAGTYNVTVTQLAQSQRLVTAGQASSTAAIGDGSATTLTLTFGGISGGAFDSVSGKYTGATFSTNPDKPAAEIRISDTNNTLQGIRDAINAAGVGVTAAIVNDGSGTPYRLTLSMQDTGSQGSLKIDVAGSADIASLLAQNPAGTQNLSQVQTARDAQLSISGINVTRPTNTVSDAVDGVTLTLSKPVTDATITVQRDNGPLTKALTDLVNAYNDTNKSIGAATGLKAVLQGDSATLGVQGRLRSALGASLSTNPNTINTLSQLGVSFQKDGSLALDTTKLQAALDQNAAGVNAAAVAFGTTLSKLADSLVSSGGAVQTRTDGINRSIDDITKQQDSINARLTTVEANYRRQFSALDAMIGGMQQTSTFLQQQLANLSKIGS